MNLTDTLCEPVAHHCISTPSRPTPATYAPRWYVVCDSTGESNHVFIADLNSTSGRYDVSTLCSMPWGYGELESLSLLQDDWDTCGAPAPSRTSLERARAFAVWYLWHVGYGLPKAVASVEGGVGFTFREPNDVNVEFDNDGSIYVIRLPDSGKGIDFDCVEIGWDPSDEDGSCANIREAITRYFGA
jgi:hypothetical protein